VKLLLSEYTTVNHINLELKITGYLSPVLNAQLYNYSTNTCYKHHCKECNNSFHKDMNMKQVWSSAVHKRRRQALISVIWERVEGVLQMWKFKLFVAKA